MSPYLLYSIAPAPASAASAAPVGVLLVLLGLAVGGLAVGRLAVLSSVSLFSQSRKGVAREGSIALVLFPSGNPFALDATSGCWGKSEFPYREVHKCCFKVNSREENKTPIIISVIGSWRANCIIVTCFLLRKSRARTQVMTLFALYCAKSNKVSFDRVLHSYLGCNPEHGRGP